MNYANSENYNITNAVFQIFTFECGTSVTNLFASVFPFVMDSTLLKLKWTDRFGRHRTASIVKLVSARDQNVTLVEGYIPVTEGNISASLKAIGCNSIQCHVSVSPSSTLWESISEREAMFRNNESPHPCDKYARSVERASQFRGDDCMPTVLEISMMFQAISIKDAVEGVIRFMSSYSCDEAAIDICGVVDFGGPGLFFPKSGYNPSISNIHVYFRPLLKSTWSKWRQSHNISFSIASMQRGSCLWSPIIHSLNKTPIQL